MTPNTAKDAVNDAISVEYRHVPRFEPTDQAAMRYLDEHGFVVIAHALSTNEAEQAVNLLWDYLEQLGTGINRFDASTWDNDRWPVSVHGGILPSLGIGHSPAQWFIRNSTRIHQAFASVWETEDLLVSFDGVSLWRPWLANAGWKTNEGGSWLHIDQHPIGRPGKHCVQGLVNLLPTSAETGGNVVIPGSHRLFEQIPSLYEPRLNRIHESIDHFRFPKNDPRLEEMQPISCHMEPGDLMLWDSRTVHCSHPGSGAGMDVSKLQRAASLICMMPRSKSNAKVIERRKKALQDGTSTTNWSDRFINADHFPDVIDVAQSDRFQWPQIPKLNAHQLTLVGFTEKEITTLL